MALCSIVQGNMWEGKVEIKNNGKYITKKIMKRMIERQG
jgi:hypothetical protein